MARSRFKSKGGIRRRARVVVADGVVVGGRKKERGGERGGERGREKRELLVGFGGSLGA